MEQVWQMLSDKGITGYLARTETGLEDDALRLILVGLLQRVKALEVQCFTLQSLLVTSGLSTAEELQQLHRQAQDYLQEKDCLREQESRIMSAFGVNTLEWLNFMQKGKFNLDNNN